MSVIDTTTSNQIGESFASLSELKHEHVALLQVVRASPREAAVNDQTYVQVMEWKGPQVTRGRLLNVSTGGALILVQ